MNDLDKYMNDPDIIDEPMPMREIHAIRLMIQAETKEMSPAERARHTHEQAQKVMEEYGLTERQPKSRGVRKIM
ncbi:MAG: hypothetical protein LBK98_05085 [Peptococcaceae bacterium]|jgi:hypothetical protein|nr:hypothetical protein [Peptococcaceae bacterium]